MVAPWPGLVDCEAYRELGEAAWAWVLGQVRGDAGLWLPEVASGDGPPAGPGADRDSVYAGIGGLAPVLAEISQYRALTGAEQALAAARTSLRPLRREPRTCWPWAGWTRTDSSFRTPCRIPPGTWNR